MELERKEQNMELLEKVLDAGNIANATKKVIENKGAGGIDGVTVQIFQDQLDNQDIDFEEIKDQIRSRKYTPSPVRRVYIPKENGDKRGLGIPTIMDRIIQQSIVQVLSPIYEKQFSETSFGFRSNRSCEMAITKVLEYFNDGYDWVVDIDLEKFFDNVCHDKLISIIMKTIHDGDLVSLIRKYLVSGVMENGVVIPTEVGRPQGGNLSPLLSNIMLNELDKELEKRGLKFTRYADDCIIVVKSEKAANRVMNSITKFIEKKLGLKVNTAKSKISRPNKIKYLGFGFYFNTTERKWKARPHEKSVQKFKRKLKAITKRSYSIPWKIRVCQINQIVRGWVNYFRLADMKSCMDTVSCHLRRRIRCLAWKNWKTCKNRYKHLKRAGISEYWAKRTAGSRQGYFHISLSWPLHQAISKELPRQFGLVSPLDHYLKVHI